MDGLKMRLDSGQRIRRTRGLLVSNPRLRDAPPWGRRLRI